MEINYRQLIFAREYRQYSQTELSSKINGLSQSNLSKFEKGLGSLSDEMVYKIIRFLNFPEEFFANKISNKVDNPHYRKRTTITKATRVDIEYSIKMIGFIIDQMTHSIEWPDFGLTPLNIEEGYTPESIAKYIRKQLGLTVDEPVKMINNLLESNGIIIVEFDTTEHFDGASFVSDKGYPVIVINKAFSNDRKRFTLAHELGHLIMHITGNFPIPDYRNLEDEANNFASEFLMPKEAIKSSLHGLRLSHLSELKRYWLTSMASIVRRAKDLGCISLDKYKYMNIEFSRRGLKRDEGISVFIDAPKLFITGYKMHRDDLEYTDEELAKAFNIPLDVLQRFCSPSRNNSKLRVLI
ncbi:MAG: XRE family transcriptional regulator [Bacteroidales bacterium]|jgi:Zn-dependent peptidase ImmA (M78 family)/transcriptional regulator with XRE-family HTH domain|nr:XRE family transcriptional regulator [Bacteroidales bacterium]